jgi:superfamily II DNA or RNA helicase
VLSKLTFPKSGEYKTGTPNEPIHFFADVLPESRQFDILLGYFSASAIRVLAIGFTKFLVQGGKGRFIINHILSEQDKTAIILGNTTDERIFDFSIQHYEHLKKSLDSFGHHFFNCLAWLIASKKIQIVAIRPKNGGISHYKSGVFTDGTHEVSFKGSCNFTGTALLSNLEELDVSLSWNDSEKETAVIANQKKYFNQIFDKEVNFVEYIPFEAIEIAIQKDFGNKDINELLANEADLIAQQRLKLAENSKLRQRFGQLEQEIKVLRIMPRFPYAEGARPYQVEAYQNWLKNDKKGIFAMATGTGKTITALNCVIEECKKHPDNLYQVIVLVPTIDLAEQWEKEAHKCNILSVLKITSKSEWRSELSNMISLNRFGGKSSFFIVCSYTTFAKKSFQSSFQRLPKTTLLIGDEVHNMGSISILNVLNNIHLNQRIGLSATPQRIYDVEGTLAVATFFNDTAPYIYSFSVEKAIEAGYLCQYRYFPHIVSLTETEQVNYIKISNKLVKFFDHKTGRYKDSTTVMHLLLERKRIIQKAHHKLAATKAILKTEFEQKGHLKYAFVYVPEGFLAENDVFDANEADTRLLKQYVEAIASIDESIAVAPFTSQTADRSTVLKSFEQGKTHVLASMKCLDEGVDIPRTELAVFCASTGNPRQFIQRRGRVLRTHKEKHLAIIHDLIVVPYQYNTDNAHHADTFKMQRTLLRKELERVVHFAFLSINEYETHQVLEAVCAHYELSLNHIHESIKSNLL